MDFLDLDRRQYVSPLSPWLGTSPLRPKKQLPVAARIGQIARNLSEARESRSTRLRFLVHDRDPRFGEPFDEVLKAEGVEILRTPWRSGEFRSRPLTWCTPRA